MDRRTLLLSLRTLEECHLFNLRKELLENSRIIYGDFRESLEQLVWCQETFAKVLPPDNPRYARFFEVYWQREKAGWSFAEIAQHWGVREPSARALVQKARRALEH